MTSLLGCWGWPLVDYFHTTYAPRGHKKDLTIAEWDILVDKGCGNDRYQFYGIFPHVFGSVSDNSSNGSWGGRGDARVTSCMYLDSREK